MTELIANDFASIAKHLAELSKQEEVKPDSPPVGEQAWFGGQLHHWNGSEWVTDFSI